MFSISAGWIKQDGDTSPCYYCTEPIYGAMYEFTLSMMGEKIAVCKACEACYNETVELKDEENS